MSRLKPDGPGPPSKLTDECIQVLTAAFSAGMYQKHAAAEANVSEDRLIEWRKAGRRPEPEKKKGERASTHRKRVDRWERCQRLNESIEKAQADFVLANLTTIRRAAGHSWQASAWLLERRFRDMFSLRVEQSGPGGGPISVEQVGPTMKELLDDPDLAAAVSDRAIAAELSRLSGGNGSTPEQDD